MVDPKTSPRYAKPVDGDLWRRKASRALIVGAPNKFKTTSLGTWDPPIHILVYPNEQGTGSLPRGEGIKTYAWEFPPGVAINKHVLVQEVFTLTAEIIAGKHGEITTFAGDGLHMFADLVLDYITDGAYSDGGETVDGKPIAFSYPRAARMVIGYLKTVLSSSVPYAVFTAWEGKEVIDPMANVMSDAPRGLYPGLPGALAKDVMGLFSVVLYADIKAIPGGHEGFWRPRPAGAIRAAGCKLPLEVAKALPATVPQSWQALKPILRIT